MRKSLVEIALAASFGLALVFTFGCTSGNDDDGGGGKSSPSGVLSSSNVHGNSSSSNGSSSVLLPCNGGTAKIGTQTWQKCNLNVVPSGANGAATNSVCYDNKESNCAIYGRLYDWATAMALPASCNSSSCSSQIGTKHKGICPSGWHIPSNADWYALMKFVDPNCSDYSNCSKAGTLKANSGGNEYGNKSGGTDDYGFSAIPSGYGSSGSYSIYFYYVGDYGAWWSAAEFSANRAYDRSIDYNFDYVIYGYYDKSDFLSVRCLQD